MTEKLNRAKIFEEAEKIMKDVERTATETDRLIDALNSPVTKAVEKRLGEVFSVPNSERQETLDRIFQEEQSRFDQENS